MAGQPLMDDVPQQGAVLTTELVEARMAGDLMAARRLEDERYAYFAEASIVFLDLPDAVFRGYEGDEQLLAAPRADDRAPIDLLVKEIARLEPQKVYLPLGVGDHVDHQLVREVGVALLELGRRWVMPGPEYAGIVTYYEDFPYAWWNDFRRLERAPGGRPCRAPRGRRPDAGVRRHHRDGRAQDPGPDALREPARAALRRHGPDGRRGPRLRDEGGEPGRPAGLRRALLGVLEAVGRTGRVAPSAGTLTIGDRRFVVPPWRHLLTMLGIGAAAITFVSLTQSGGDPVDAWCYWRIDPSHPYTLGESQFVYTPVAAQLLTPFLQLPFPVFVALIRFVDLVALVALAGPATLPALFLPPVAAEINAANINFPMGLAILAAFRWPGLWAFPLLTKVTPGVGVIWFAVRREWRPFAIAVGITAGLAAVSFLANPSLWFEYVEFLANDTPHAGGWPFPYPLWLRLPLAIALVIWGARTDRRWVVPAAALLALPRLYFQSPALLIAVLPTLHGGWASIERWGRKRRGAG